jgi:hypothetical protein
MEVLIIWMAVRERKQAQPWAGLIRQPAANSRSNCNMWCAGHNDPAETPLRARRNTRLPLRTGPSSTRRHATGLVRQHRPDSCLFVSHGFIAHDPILLFVSFETSLCQRSASESPIRTVATAEPLAPQAKERTDPREQPPHRPDPIASAGRHFSSPRVTRIHDRAIGSRTITLAVGLLTLF